MSNQCARFAKEFHFPAVFLFPAPPTLCLACVSECVWMSGGAGVRGGGGAGWASLILPLPAAGPSKSFASPVIPANDAGGPLFLSAWPLPQQPPDLHSSQQQWPHPWEAPTASLSALAPESLIILFDRDKNVFALNIANSETRCEIRCTFISEHPCLLSLPSTGRETWVKGKRTLTPQLQQ